MWWRNYNHFHIWDFLMFYQVFCSQQLKRCAIVNYKHGIYKLPNDLRLYENIMEIGN